MNLLSSNVDNRIKDLLYFFSLSFLISWSLWIPRILWPNSDTFQIIGIIGSFGPSISAVILIGVKSGKNQIGKFLKEKTHSKFKRSQYLYLIFLGPLIGVISWIIVEWGFNQPVNTDALMDPLFLIMGFFYVMILGGPLGEEYGWRGYALERLIRDETHSITSRDILLKSILLGLIWSVWHIPLFYTTGSVQEMIPFWQYTLQTIVFGILYTWAYYRTNKSVWAAILLHTTLNLSSGLFPTYETLTGRLTGFFILLFITAGLIFKDRKKSLDEIAD